MTERLGDHHEFDWASADSAHVLGQGGAEYSELVGERPPDVRLPSGTGFGRGPALLEVVTGGQELRQAVTEQLLFLAQVEVHLKPQSRLGEDVPLNLVAAGVDRACAVVEVTQWRDRLPRLAADVPVRRRFEL